MAAVQCKLTAAFFVLATDLGVDSTLQTSLRYHGLAQSVHGLARITLIGRVILVVSNNEAP